MSATKHSDQYCGWCDGCAHEKEAFRALAKQLAEALERAHRHIAPSAHADTARYCDHCAGVDALNTYRAALGGKTDG